jgi:hypothetical protein
MFQKNIRGIYVQELFINNFFVGFFFLSALTLIFNFYRENEFKLERQKLLN